MHNFFYSEVFALICLNRGIYHCAQFFFEYSQSLYFSDNIRPFALSQYSSEFCKFPLCRNFPLYLILFTPQQYFYCLLFTILNIRFIIALLYYLSSYCQNPKLTITYIRVRFDNFLVLTPLWVELLTMAACLSFLS